MAALVSWVDRRIVCPMNKYLTGAIAALLLASGGLFLWFGAQSEVVPVPAAPPPPVIADPLDVPSSEVASDIKGPPPPEPPKAHKLSREEVRFNRYDRNRDEIITRIELMSSRTKAFRQLDRDGNNLLTFEEWAVGTSDRFAKSDVNKDGKVNRSEFATTRPKPAPKPKCDC